MLLVAEYEMKESENRDEVGIATLLRHLLP